MASPDRALLANVEIYLAEGNIRRGISGFANNMLAQTAGGDFQDRRLLLGPGSNATITAIAGNSATIIRCSKPVKITANVAPSATPTVFLVNSLFIYTGELGDLTIANESTTLDSKVTVLQI